MIKKHKTITYLINIYSPMVIIKSFLSGFIFFIFPTALVGALAASIIPLYLYNLYGIIFGLYVIVVIIAIFANKITIDTLKNYVDKSDVYDYKSAFIFLSLVASAIIFLVFIAVFITVKFF